MSDYRAIAAATQTLQNLLLEAIREAVPGATVKTGPPEVRPPEEVGEGLINIFLFKVEPNKVWRNEELPVRASNGSMMRKPVLAIDLHYLLSFYGDERRKIPYLLLGLALTALHAEPYPGIRHMPHATPRNGELDSVAEDPISATLSGSGLEHQPHPLSFTLLPLSHDELIPLFSQIPFVMSVAFRAAVLTLEPYGLPQPALPVRRADFYLTGARRPRLTSIDPQLLPFSNSAQVTLRGEALGSPTARVLFDDLEAQPEVQPDGSLITYLPFGIQAGTRLVRVADTTAAAGTDRRNFVVESNPLALVIEPVVVKAEALRLARQGGSEEGEAGASAPHTRARLQVRMAPPVSAAVAVQLLLNEWLPGEAGRTPRAYVLDTQADPRTADLLVAEADVEPATYLVRVQLNGVASRLAFNVDPHSPSFNRYDGPRVEVP